ncbi:hypothetical protein ACFU5Y_04115 [Streptomyces gardneri]|uniref:hypothetical protein n=1 Tax=Streptomyces gardneri TaxID=66892 RepID=UPI00368BE1E2
MSANPIERLDMPAEQVAAEAVLLNALAATHSPSDALAYRIDLWLVTHPDAPVSTDADYPNWTPGGTR